jgi:hypothetical protein
MGTIRALWAKYRNNPWFVAAYTAFGGALAAEIQQAGGINHVAFDEHNVIVMLKTAALTAGTALWHLYQTSPKAGNT